MNAARSIGAWRIALGLALAGALADPAARAAEPAECSGACPAPALEPPEAALLRAVHLTWTDPRRSAARRYEIERRAVGADAWASVAQEAPDRPAHHDDAGAAGTGLAAGEYEYRLRALYRIAGHEVWSEWSAAQRATVRECCADAGGELAGLPRVVAADLDGDRRYTGADLTLALHECAKRGGCVIEALPVTYDDVAISIYDGDPGGCDAARTACLTDRFPNGLAIEGHGRSTVLRSPVWPSPSPYLPEPVLELWHRPDVRLHVRHLVLDGRKSEQRDPLPGQNNSVGWQHYGLHVWNQWKDHDNRNQKGCVHDVIVRDFLSRGISLADVARWSIEYSTIQDIGCARSLTPCPQIKVPDTFGPGYTSTAYAIHIEWYSDDVAIRHNRVLRATKYGISFKHGQDGAETSIRRPRVEDNDLDETGQLGIFLAGVADGRFARNRIARTDSLSQEPEKRPYNDTFAISCNGAVERTIFSGNRIENSDGMAIQWNCVGRANAIADTVVTGSCRRKGPKSCSPTTGGCYVQPDIWVPDGAGGTLALVDDQVSESACASPLAVDLTQRDMQVTVRGGRYAAGRNATAPIRFLAADVLLDRGVEFTGARLEFGADTRAIIAPSVSLRGARGTRVDPRAEVVDCVDDPKACKKSCARSDPPPWCRVIDGESPLSSDTDSAGESPAER